MATSIKISQLPAKGANLEATDLLEVSEFNGTGYVSKSITGAEIIASIPPTTVEWGDIGGTLSAQTDLNTALNAKVTGNTAITGATKTKITYDSKGLVTSGADATTADIADSTNKRYVTDANLTTLSNTSGVNTGDQTLSGLGGVPTSRTLTINGTTQDLSADRTFTISTGITIGTTAITSGTVGRVLFEGTGNVVQESANLFWDNTNGRLGIGTSSPTTIVHINGSTAGTAPSLQIRQQTNTVPTWFSVRNTDTLGNAGAISLDIGISGGTNQFFTGTSQGDIVLKAYSQANTSKFFLGATSASTAQMVLFPITGNVAINTTTDAGFKLDVNGTARFTGNVSLGSPNINDKLEVYGNILVRANDRIRLAGTSDGNTALWANSGASAQMNVKNGSASAFDITFGSIGSTTRMVRVNAYDSTTPSVAIGNNATSFASAVLSADSTTQGFLCPRGTNTQMLAIATPAAGLMFIDNTTATNNILNLYNGTGWGSVLTSNPTVTAATALGRGFNFTPALTAAANNDVLVGLDINPTFTNGAFTGVTNYALRLSTGGFLVGADFTQSSSAYKISGSDATLALRNTASGGYAGVNMYDNANTLTGTFQIGGTAVGSPFQNNMFIGARQSAGKLIFVRGTSATESMTLFSTGNFAINTTTDAGFKLDVNGTARFTGAVTTLAFTTSSNYLGVNSNTGGGIYGITQNNTWYIWNRRNNTSGDGIGIDDFNTNGGSNTNLNVLNIGGSFQTTGTCSHSNLAITRTINLASGTQTIRGIYYNPTLTNTTGLTSHFALHSTSGGILINSASPNASAIIQADSTTQGFLPPRQTQAQRTAIASPAVGLIVYQTDLVEGLYIYKSTGWQFIA